MHNYLMEKLMRKIDKTKDMKTVYGVTKQNWHFITNY